MIRRLRARLQQHRHAAIRRRMERSGELPREGWWKEESPGRSRGDEGEEQCGA
jgi:hypothetical protein